MKIFRILAASIALIAAMLAAPSPAQAWQRGCGALAGSGDNLIGLCFDDRTYPDGPSDNSIQLNASLILGKSVTATTTTCKITMRAELDKPGSAPWSYSSSKSCTNQVRNQQGKGWVDYKVGVAARTTAQTVKVHACVEFYWNGSSTLGRRLCESSNWHAVTLDEDY
ncbi:hypothetical protein AB0F81_23640 [Actinoplanes sp. NPDC024001]|uniref:hypothetical protein n=1 Tax=Actinoplanes sp. NPDC024001 TaxID=3154598 RepID=UPI00340CDDE3